MQKNDFYIQSVEMSGYKSIRDLKIDFEPGLNIIIGKNGSGKTNFLEFLEKIVTVKFNSLLEDNRFGFKTFSIKTLKNNYETLVNVKREGLEQTLEIIKNNEKILSEKYELNYLPSMLKTISDEGLGVIISTANKRTEFLYLNLNFNCKVIKFNIPEEQLYLDTPCDIHLGTIFDSRGSSSFYFTLVWHFDFMRWLYDTSLQFNKIGEFNNKLEYFFENHFEGLIHSFFGDQILSSLQKFTPIQDLRISPNFNLYFRENEKTIENLYFEFKINNEWHSWQSLSDGTKRLFYLVTQVLFSKDLVLLEEPELGVHPHQLHLLMTFLKEQAETKQIILTTHSPQVLDILNDNELNHIIIAEMTDKGTQLRHLTEKQMKKAGIYLKDSFLSDYWRFSDLEPVI